MTFSCSLFFALGRLITWFHTEVMVVFPGWLSVMVEWEGFAWECVCLLGVVNVDGWLVSGVEMRDWSKDLVCKKEKVYRIHGNVT